MNDSELYFRCDLDVFLAIFSVYRLLLLTSVDEL